MSQLIRGKSLINFIFYVGKDEVAAWCSIVQADVSPQALRVASGTSKETSPCSYPRHDSGKQCAPKIMKVKLNMRECCALKYSLSLLSTPGDD